MIETPGEEASGLEAVAPPVMKSRWFEDVQGTLSFRVHEQPVASLIVDHGEARLAEADGLADTTVICTSQDDVDGLIRGALNPVTLALLGRLEIEGDVILGVHVLQSLRDAHPAAGS